MFNIITPCVRKHNLEKIAASISHANLAVTWLVILDQVALSTEDALLKTNLEDISKHQVKLSAIKSSESVSGNAQRNHGLNQLNKQGYVYFVDDDNLIHPNFWNYTHLLDGTHGIIGHQLLADGQLRKAAGFHVCPNKIDIAQCCFPMKLVGKNRWIEKKYNADGLFASHIHHLNTDKFIIIDDVIAYYNRLGPVWPQGLISA